MSTDAGTHPGLPVDPPVDQTSWPVHLARPVGPPSWPAQPTRPCDRAVDSCSSLVQLTRSEPACFTPRVTDHSSRFWRRVHLDLVRYAGCMCRPSC
ncbi:putative leader peptide [Streptomyces sp. N2A]|uniref:putative leader peptide n=1 Tax=Streptomyces sp. N2A TaxID=3073936 RepID=UPI00286FE390|nr:putative leader peptide [Streptomyces sp. N2A]